MSEGLSRKPYPEARPPHLPDVLTRQSPWLFAFAAVAVVHVWETWTAWYGDNPDPQIDALPALIVPLIPAVATALLGAALFLRHTDARRTMPLLVFGLALFAVGVLLSALDGPIRTLLQGITPRSGQSGFDTDVFDTPAETAYRVFAALLALFAVLYTAAGLSAARRPERGPAERPMLIWLTALAIISSVVSMAGVTQLGVAPSPAVVLQFAIGSVLSLLLSIGWAYLVAVAVGGWLAGDVPHRAWGLAALAVSVLFAGNVLFSVLTTLLAGEAAFTIFTIVSYATLIAWVVLLGAFVLGLPSPPETAADVSADGADPTGDPQEATQPGSAAG